MNKTVGIVLGVVGVILLVIAIGVGTVWQHRNVAVSLEEKIDAQYISNKSNYDNMWKKFKEMTQVTDMQAEDFKNVYTDLIEGRNQDAQLLFKAVQEDNPQLDSTVYTQLQREISAGRTQFDNNQKTIADIVREYNTYVRKHIIMSAITNREPKDANKYIVTSEKTNNAFNSGKDEAIDLR